MHLLWERKRRFVRKKTSKTFRCDQALMYASEIKRTFCVLPCGISNDTLNQSRQKFPYNNNPYTAYQCNKMYVFRIVYFCSWETHTSLLLFKKRACRQMFGYNRNKLKDINSWGVIARKRFHCDPALMYWKCNKMYVLQAIWMILDPMPVIVWIMIFFIVFYEWLVSWDGTPGNYGPYWVITQC